MVTAKQIADCALVVACLAIVCVLLYGCDDPAPDMLLIHKVQDRCAQRPADLRSTGCRAVVSHTERCAELVGDHGVGCTATDTYRLIWRAGLPSS